MANDVRELDVHEVLERHHARFEVLPYYVMVDQRSVGRPPVEQRIQAGFDVELYGTLEHEQFPLFHGEEGLTVVNHCKMIAQRIQSDVGHQCTIQVIPCFDSIILDTQHHFQPQAMLRIRICHQRGMDQPKGPAEEQALKALQDALHALQVKRG
jgi:hypothetical protein